MAIIDCDFWKVRRKFGGAAGAFCRGAPYIRMKPSPCNRASRRQMRGRALWQYLAWAWMNVLPEWLRSEWDAWAEDVTWHDDQEQYRWLSGFEWFCGVNARVLLAGLPLWVEGRDLFGGDYLSALSVELLTSTRARFTFTPDPEEWWGFVAFGRGPTSVGDSRVVPEAEWWRVSVLPGWYWIGFGGLGVASPVELDLPAAIPPGRKLRVIACLMSECGLYVTDWEVAEVVA